MILLRFLWFLETKINACTSFKSSTHVLGTPKSPEEVSRQQRLKRSTGSSLRPYSCTVLMVSASGNAPNGEGWPGDSWQQQEGSCSSQKFAYSPGSEASSLTSAGNTPRHLQDCWPGKETFDLGMAGEGTIPAHMGVGWARKGLLLKAWILGEQALAPSGMSKRMKDQLLQTQIAPNEQG